MWAKLRRVCAALGVTTALTATASAAGAAPTRLEALLSRQLADVQSRLESFCASRCDRVLLEASRETSAAMLEPIDSGASWILYNERFFRHVVGKYGRGAAYAILAHEYGHHVDEPRGASAWTQELRADAVAGCALARGGVPLGPALSWMRHEHFDEIWQRVYGDPNDPEEVLRKYVASHPYWIDRIGALKRGVEVCEGGGGALALGEFFDRTRTRAPEVQTDPATLFAELPFRQGSTRSLAVVAPRELLTSPATARLSFGRYSLPAGVE
jgi:hypothetical protein